MERSVRSQVSCLWGSCRLRFSRQAMQWGMQWARRVGWMLARFCLMLRPLNGRWRLALGDGT
jgi:hypothetical protein